MGDKSLLQDEYNFYLIGSESSKNKPTQTRKKRLNIHEVGTSTILARFKRSDGMVQETVIPHVPTFLWDTYKCLMVDECVHDEIFRKCGSTKRIADFFKANPSVFVIGSHGFTQFDGLNQLDIGTLMKDFLRERLLPIFMTGDPVLNDLEEIVNRGLGIEFDCDAHPELGTFIFVIKVLHSLCIKDTTQKITPSNLAIYFAPIFISDHKELKPKPAATKKKLKKHIDLLTALISKSQHVIIRSTSSSRNRSNSITHGTILTAEGRRSSSVFGRFMRYVSKNNPPRVSSIAVDKIPFKDSCTPEVRQSRSRTRRTPSSSANEHHQFMATPQTPESISSKHRTEIAIASSNYKTPTSHFVNKSAEKPPKMRTDETVEYLLEARKRLAFNEVEHMESKPNTPIIQPTQLDDLLNSLQKSVERLNKSIASPTPSGLSTPGNGSFTFKRYDSPSAGEASPILPQKCSTPEIIINELISSVEEAEKEMKNICEEMVVKSAMVEQLKKETKDQSCSPINLPEIKKSPPALCKSTVSTTTYTVRSNWHRLTDSNFLEPQSIPTTKIKINPSKYRTNSGAFDGVSAAQIINSTTQEELEAQIGATNFPLHRPSIALLTKSKQVTKNIARLEWTGEGSHSKRDEAMRKGPTFAKPTISSGSKSYSKPPDDFKMPALPKSRSTGSAALAAIDGHQKPPLPPKFLAPKLPASKITKTSSIPKEEYYRHPCRTSFDLPRDPTVPNYATSTFASIQHAQRRETTFTSPHHSRENSDDLAQINVEQSLTSQSTTTLSSLDDLEALISRLSVSTLDADN